MQFNKMFTAGGSMSLAERPRLMKRWRQRGCECLTGTEAARQTGGRWAGAYSWQLISADGSTPPCSDHCATNDVISILVGYSDWLVSLLQCRLSDDNEPCCQLLCRLHSPVPSADRLLTITSTYIYRACVVDKSHKSRSKKDNTSRYHTAERTFSNCLCQFYAVNPMTCARHCHRRS